MRIDVDLVGNTTIRNLVYAFSKDTARSSVLKVKILFQLRSADAYLRVKLMLCTSQTAQERKGKKKKKTKKKVLQQK